MGHIEGDEQNDGNRVSAMLENNRSSADTAALAGLLVAQSKKGP